MSFWRLVGSSLRFHWRIHAAVALGVAAATAVLTGALVVGDSVRASLRELTLGSLGRIDQALATDRFFRVELARELESREAFRRRFAAARPAILFPRATAENRGVAQRIGFQADGAISGSSGRTRRSPTGSVRSSKPRHARGSHSDCPKTKASHPTAA